MSAELDRHADPAVDAASSDQDLCRMVAPALGGFSHTSAEQQRARAAFYELERRLALRELWKGIG